MKKFIYSISLIIFISFNTSAQEDQKEEHVPGHYNNNPFKQLYEEFSTPNQYRSASGAPGPAYYQQQADYVMDIELDEENNIINGNETIIYTNNSPDILNYLWIQLDQNIRKKV